MTIQSSLFGSSLLSAVLSLSLAVATVGALALPGEVIARDVNVTGPRGNTVNRHKDFDRDTATMNSTVTGPGGNTVNRHKTWQNGTVNSTITGPTGHVTTRNANRESGTITGPNGQSATRQTVVDPATGSSSSTLTGPNGHIVTRRVNR
ncbi:MAG: hypothetical protein H6970_07340 [Gammaproteobacteria bacterium]|nr:hypothetical protein [Gammaproteobacteria bacterium]MCP5424868.1 hypothetical protein [Gammaproteobacteria bacterium]MCP5458155.1 hypothetical protein [Gammaproteobacteria bacterium]